MVDLNGFKNMVWIPYLTVHGIPPLDIICPGIVFGQNENSMKCAICLVWVFMYHVECLMKCP